jgi:hypothetical protein
VLHHISIIRNSSWHALRGRRIDPFADGRIPVGRLSLLLGEGARVLERELLFVAFGVLIPL